MNLNSIRQFLAKPFPQEERFTDSIKIIAAISLFVFIFLYIFKPFGIHAWQGNQLLLCLNFGLVSFLASLIYELIIVKVLKVKGSHTNFTFGRWILYFMGAIISISLANFLFVRLAFFGDIQWNLYLPMLRGTLAIGIFPAIVFGGMALLKLERKYQNIAGDFNRQNRSNLDNKIDRVSSLFNIPSDSIRYIEAMQNYINIGYLEQGGVWQEQLERATLKSIPLTDLGQNIMRCHRSYMVNREAIIEVTGNAQGLLLSLDKCEKKIPVSRSYVAEFR